MKVLKEPLLHFLLIGFSLFAVQYWLAEPQQDSHVITLDKQRVSGLEVEFERTHERKPNPDELDGMQRAYVQDEVFYREAMTLGLHKNDPVVRRRLIQQMQLLVEQSAVRSEPAEAQLEQWLNQHKDRYLPPKTVTLEHVFFSNQSSDYLSRSKAVGAGGEPSSEGDPFALGRRFTRWDEVKLTRKLGSDFGRQVMALPIGQWSGPVTSKFGVHLVKVLERTAASEVELNDVRQRVHADYMTERRLEARKKALERLLQRYKVVTE